MWAYPATATNRHGVIDEDRPYHPASKALAHAEPDAARPAPSASGTKGANRERPPVRPPRIARASRACFSAEGRGSATAIARGHLDARPPRGEGCRSAATATPRRSPIWASSDARSSGTSGRGFRRRRHAGRASCSSAQTLTVRGKTTARHCGRQNEPQREVSHEGSSPLAPVPGCTRLSRHGSESFQRRGAAAPHRDTDWCSGHRIRQA